MNKKFYLSSAAAVALLSACTSDELVPQQNGEATDVLANRPKIEVALNFDATTRMFAENGTTNVKFDINDKLGAVLVDKGLSTPANYWDLATSNTHIGNNKFYYDAASSRFVTDGTMCVGSWLFYAPFNDANTASRGSIKFDMPIVQEYAQDFTELAKAGKEWRFTPIINLETEGENDSQVLKTLCIKTVSPYTYANVKLSFPQAVTVQKLVLKPSAAIDGTSYAPFAHTYELNMGNGTKGLSAAVADVNNYPVRIGGTYYSKQYPIDQAEKALKAKNPYIEDVIVPSGTTTEQLIALNCLDKGMTASKDFQSFMLIPSGKYKCIRLYAYTDKGVYVYNINDECEAAPATGRPATLPTADAGSITLARTGVGLHNIAGYKSENDPNIEGIYNQDYATLQTKAIQMTETRNNVQLQASTETNGTVVISQKDLVAVIKGISVAGQMNVRVLGNMVKINKEVADAIAAKEREVGDIQLYFDRAVEIEGEADAYTLTDVTVDGGATLTKGAVNMGDDIDIPAGKILTVNSGATLNVTTTANTVAGYSYNQINNNGTLNVDAVGTTITTVNNKGTMDVKKNANITTLTNEKAVAIEEGAMLNTAFTNNHPTSISATLTNNGTLNVNGASSNSDIMTNNGTVNVQNVILTNSGTIVNNADCKIISGVTGGSTAAINNTGTITNLGFLYCFNGDNTINNTGTIKAKAGSTTYITTNSSGDEFANGTKAVTMGKIILDNREEDVSVTTPTQKGYIIWTPGADVTTIQHKAGDKYNKVILSAASTVNNANVRYIETSANLNLQSNVQELTFTKIVVLTAAESANILVGYLEIASGKTVKLPTENKILVKEVCSGTNSKTIAQINNMGTLLVGGNLWSTLACPTTGTFASGDGNSTAFHWNETGI